MNWYFCLFALYVLFITPLTFHVSVRIGQGVHYRVKVQAAGLPVAWRKGEPQKQKEKQLSSRKTVRKLLSTDGGMLLSLLRCGALNRLCSVFRVQNVWVHIRFSFADAAQTALCYAALRLLLQTLFSCVPRTAAVNGRAEADFRAQGTEMFVRCILSARLGMLITALARTGAAVIRLRMAAAAKEETYAEASH